MPRAVALVRHGIARATRCPDCKVCAQNAGPGLRAYANADACGRCAHCSCPGGGMPQ